MYNKEELIERLRTKESVVTFTKLNGDQRIMTCTLDPAIIPQEAMPKGSKEPKEPSAKQLENVGVYDINAKGWRSFKVANVTDIQTVEQAHDELIETIKQPVTHYRIRVWGYGGESVYARINKKAYEFWNKVKQGEIVLDTNPDLMTLQDYMLDPETFRKFNDMDQEADFLWDEDSESHKDWYEAPREVIHQNGVTVDSAMIEVDEVEDQSWGSKWVNTILENIELEKLLNKNGKEVKISDIDLDEYADKDGHNYIFYGMSIEKGTFNDVYLKLEGKKFDPSRLGIDAEEMPNGDTVITSITYNDIELDGDFGDTTGKGFDCDVYDY